jgi:hypothetical protein
MTSRPRIIVGGLKAFMDHLEGINSMTEQGLSCKRPLFAVFFYIVRAFTEDRSLNVKLITNCLNSTAWPQVLVGSGWQRLSSLIRACILCQHFWTLKIQGAPVSD